MNMDQYYMDNGNETGVGIDSEFFNTPENVARVQPMVELSEQLIERINANSNKTALFEVFKF